ncbi:MAG: hypothetical protein K0Q49_1746 [Haloplasmataceae bacterium]|jgi:hypothetical protein|nr:hypothetical protein [Haloplasmataceae bacterium]
MTKEQEVEIKNNLKIDKISIVDYNNFFNDANCRFSLDDNNELQHLNSLLNRLLMDDRLASVYVSMYYDELEDVDHNMFWYSDTIILDTNMSLSETENYFADCNFQPSQIIEQEELLYFVLINGQNNVYKNKCKNLISIYWD